MIEHFLCKEGSQETALHGSLDHGLTPGKHISDLVLKTKEFVPLQVINQISFSEGGNGDRQGFFGGFVCVILFNSTD